MWYTASILLEGSHRIEPPIPSLWEEVIVLLEANNDDEAYSRAEAIGRGKAHEYHVPEPTPHVLRWDFFRVERVYALPDPTLHDGTELFSRFLRQSEVESLLAPFDDHPTGGG